MFNNKNKIKVLETAVSHLIEEIDAIKISNRVLTKKLMERDTAFMEYLNVEIIKEKKIQEDKFGEDYILYNLKLVKKDEKKRS